MNQLNLDLTTTDEEFFGTLESNKSNLNQLFGVTPHPQHENPTLKYQAPKLNTTTNATPQSTPISAAQNWSVQLAKVVTAYKDSTLVGKAGVAFLRSGDGKSKVIVYKTKINVLATLTLESRPVIYRQSPYLQFYDDSHCYWSLLFEKRSDEDELIDKLTETNANISTMEENKNIQADQLDANETTTMQVQHENEIDETKIESAPENRTKATLVSRMAKMGQKLPIFTSATTENSDSSDTEVVSTPLPTTKKPTVVPRSSKLNQRSHVATLTNSNCVDVYSGVSTYPLQLQETQLMHMLLTDNRTQNTEIRMNMNKLESKIEKVLDKMDLLSTGNPGKNNKEDEILELEEKLLELKKENRKLKQVQNGDRNEASSCEKFSILHAKELDDLRIVHPANWEIIGEILLDSVKSLKIENAKLETEGQKFANDLKKKVEEHSELNSTISIMQSKLATLEDELKNSKAEVEKQQHIVQELKLKLQVLEQTHLDEKSKDNAKLQATVKEIMNNLYSSIASKLSNIPAGSLGNEQILAMVGKAIRNETLHSIQKTS